MKYKFDKCPICHRTNMEIHYYDGNAKYQVDCQYCGRYKVTSWQLNTRLVDYYDLKNPDLDMSIVLRNLSEASTDEIELTIENYDEIKSSVRVPDDPLEILDILMQYCSRKASRFNVGISIPKHDIPLLYIHDDSELQAVLLMAADLEYIGPYTTGNDSFTFFLYVKGWERISQLRKRHPESKQVFVAMKFGDPDLDNAYIEAIAPAVTECGYQAFRIDKKDHNGKICDRIVKEIKQSAFVIADFTGQRGGVYFEAGHALGLGIPVVWCCREDDFDNLHFDTRQYNHIKWSDPSDLKEKLINRIKATIT
ncbi:MAG: hypothetical protein CVU49_01920 [Candidatus Cloacimonetes bacterium HGW-Cloacimonetes-2]|nr:MAG: hypothetical protein CVU49_01920 [Candidatus Cloacimonetes bacterium HGW-Cloacimonetes-2]